MNVLIAVDVQHDFIDGALAVPDAMRIITPLSRLMLEADFVIATQDWHPVNHCSFAVPGTGGTTGQWPPHCVSLTPGAKLHSTVDVMAGLVIRKGHDRDKDAYSGFDGTLLADTLAGINDRYMTGITRVTIAGLATDYCVKATALDCAKEGWTTRVDLSACRGITEATTEPAIAEMRAVGIEVLNA